MNKLNITITANGHAFLAMTHWLNQAPAGVTVDDVALLNAQEEPPPAKPDWFDDGLAKHFFGPAAGQVAPQGSRPSVKAKSVTQRRPWMNDPRLVMDSENKHIDVVATMKKMGVTFADLRAARFKRGTLEQAVKSSAAHSAEFKHHIVRNTPSK